MIPFIGQIDDSFLVAISLLRLMSRADPKVFLDNWDGEMNLKRLVDSLIDLTTVFLPKPVRYALTAKIDVNEPRSLRKVRRAAGDAGAV